MTNAAAGAGRSRRSTRRATGGSRSAREELPPVPKPWRLGAVLTVEAGLAQKSASLTAPWARSRSTTSLGRARRVARVRLGPEITAVHQVLSAGDVVPVDARWTVAEGSLTRFIRFPQSRALLVALDPHTGRVLALVGGFDFATSEFDRATQARRQPGSAFKPFVYLAALDHGYTPASIVLDAPVVIDQGEHLRKWKPENYTERFYGPSTLRVGLEESRNLMTLRVAQDIGMKTVADYAARFGLYEELPELPSAALGSMETTPLDLAAAYAMLVNGGRKIEPAFVERIQDRNGRTVYRRDARACDLCQPRRMASPAAAHPARHSRPVIADPRTTYQVVSILEGAVQRGTGRALRKLGRVDRRQDGNYQRVPRCLVRRLHPRPGRRGLRRLRPAAIAGTQGVRRPCGGTHRAGFLRGRPGRQARRALPDSPRHPLRAGRAWLRRAAWPCQRRCDRGSLSARHRADRSGRCCGQPKAWTAGSKPARFRSRGWAPYIERPLRKGPVDARGNPVACR